MAEEGNVLLVHVKGWITDRPICPPEFLYGNTLRESHRNIKMCCLKEMSGYY